MYRKVLDRTVQKRTITYMNVSDFRTNLKDHFDEALKGNPVVIERGGVNYRLTAEIISKKDLQARGLENSSFAKAMGPPRTPGTPRNTQVPSDPEITPPEETA
jgi:hypothetical protein